jgi:hypothetical protein
VVVVDETKVGLEVLKLVREQRSPMSFSSSSSSSSNKPCRAKPSREKKWESTKMPVSRRSSSSSDDRWNVHKKAHRPLQADRNDDDSEDDIQSNTGSNNMEVDNELQQKQMGLYAGPSLLAIARPEPSMLPPTSVSDSALFRSCLGL